MRQIETEDKSRLIRLALNRDQTNMRVNESWWEFKLFLPFNRQLLSALIN